MTTQPCTYAAKRSSHHCTVEYLNMLHSSVLIHKIRDLQYDRVGSWGSHKSGALTENLRSLTVPRPSLWIEKKLQLHCEKKVWKRGGHYSFLHTFIMFKQDPNVTPTGVRSMHTNYRTCTTFMLKDQMWQWRWKWSAKLKLYARSEWSHTPRLHVVAKSCDSRSRSLSCWALDLIAIYLSVSIFFSAATGVSALEKRSNNWPIVVLSLRNQWGFLPNREQAWQASIQCITINICQQPT